MITDPHSLAPPVPVKTLNMHVPFEAWKRGRLAAEASNLSFKEYVAHLLLNAAPIFPSNPVPDPSPQSSEVSHAR